MAQPAHQNGKRAGFDFFRSEKLPINSIFRAGTIRALPKTVATIN
jgi:hypothetical protein